MGKVVSEQTVQASWNVAAGSSAIASFECVSTWHTDFRKDVAHINVPTLVMHGDADRILSHHRFWRADRETYQGSPPGCGGGWAALYHLDAFGNREP